MRTDIALTNLANAIRRRGNPVCMETDPDAWFPEPGAEGGTYRNAVKLCEQCPVRRECAEYGVSTSEFFGIWGGLTARTRQAIRLGHLTLDDALAGKRLSSKIRIDNPYIKLKP